ncbi:MAG: hypothetical protein IPH78_12460 [Bacteroidetes bacterium]|nr:hypothetical protein [Bacteroidota bacterium]
MRKHFLYIILFVPLLVLANGQEDDIPRAWKQTFQQANKLFDVCAYDSAIGLWKEIDAKLQAADLEKSRFRLQTLMKIGQAYTLADRHEAGLAYLYPCIELCEKEQVYDVLVMCKLMMALQQEVNGQGEACKRELDEALQLIKNHQLDSLYGHLGVRYSSYHRFFGQMDSAKYYAQMAIDYGQKYPGDIEYAWGNMLLANYVMKDNPARSIQYRQAANDMWMKLNNVGGLANGLLGIAAVYQTLGQYDTANLLYDSAIALVEKQQDKYLETWFGWEQKADIAEQMGDYKTALYYHKKSKDIYAEREDSLNRMQVMEIQEKYKNEVIQTELQQKRRFLNALYIGLAILMMLLAILIYQYRKIKTANTALRHNTRELKRLNQVKETILGEIHHRVKNNLQLIIGMMELDAAASKNKAVIDYAEEMSNRIFSISEVHELFYDSSEETQMNLKLYIQTLLDRLRKSYHKTGLKAHIQCTDTYYNIDTLIPLGIIINELLSNTMKHADKPAIELHIYIHVLEDAREFHLQYRDNGKGYPETLKMGFGMSMIQNMVRQLDGRVEIFQPGWG